MNDDQASQQGVDGHVVDDCQVSEAIVYRRIFKRKKKDISLKAKNTFRSTKNGLDR